MPRGTKGCRREVRSFVWVVALGDDAGLRRPHLRAAGRRPPILVECGPRRSQIRGRGELVARLPAGLAGLLHRPGDRHLAVADQGLPRQHLLLARSGIRSRRECRHLERGASVREDVRQIAPGSRTEHREHEDARQLERPGDGCLAFGPGLPDARSGRQIGPGTRRVELPGRGYSVRRHPRLLQLVQQRPLAGEDGRHRLVPARHGPDRGSALRKSAQHRARNHRPRPERSVLRPR